MLPALCMHGCVSAYLSILDVLLMNFDQIAQDQGETLCVDGFSMLARGLKI